VGGKGTRRKGIIKRKKDKKKKKKKRIRTIE
jgi:hypothetical protein